MVSHSDHPLPCRAESIRSNLTKSDRNKNPSAQKDAHFVDPDLFTQPADLRCLRLLLFNCRDLTKLLWMSED